MTENIHPLSGKIDSAAALKAALKEVNKYRTLGRYKYRELRHDVGIITDETFHLWRDELRIHTQYWIKIKYHGNTNKVEQDATLHLTKHDGQAFVAFTENMDKRKRDVFTRIRYGKFLTKFHPEIKNEEVKRLVAEFEYAHGTPPELKIGETAEDFVHAIKDGPSDSCQANKFYSDGKFHFQGHAHPAICYASGDIQVAWIEDNNGAVTARALINKEKKYHSRPYGDTDRIDRQLANAGYEKRSGALIGCRLLCIEDLNENGWLMPYVDAGTASGGGSLHAERENDYWVLCTDNGIDTYCGYEKKGVTDTCEEEEEEEDPEYGHCNRCGEGLFYEDDYVFSEHEDATYCTSCADRYWVHAIVAAGRNRNSHGYDYVNSDNTTYIDCLNESAWDDCISELGVVCDSHTDKWIFFEDAVLCIWDSEYHHINDCVEAGSNEDGPIYLHKEDLEDKNLADKIYYNESGDPFWHESNEIQEWVEAGDELDKYVLKAVVAACPEEATIVTGHNEVCPGGTWQEVYRWMQSQGIEFDCDDSSGIQWTPMICNFDSGAKPSHYRIRPNQPDIPGWREKFREAQKRGVKFEVVLSGSEVWQEGYMSFNADRMSNYRIQKITQEERIAA